MAISGLYLSLYSLSFKNHDQKQKETPLHAECSLQIAEMGQTEE